MSRTTCWFQSSAHELTSGDRPRPAVQHACEGLAAADVLIVARVSGLVSRSTARVETPSISPRLNSRVIGSCRMARETHMSLDHLDQGIDFSRRELAAVDRASDQGPDRVDPRLRSCIRGSFGETGFLAGERE